MEPITRKEMYLAAAAGQEVDLPAPVTREEMFLYKIAKNGGVSSWNDLTETVEILPETTVDCSEGEGNVETDAVLETGKEYTVNYNGVEYAVSSDLVDDRGFVYFGNLGALDETMPTSKEPFVLVYAPPTEENPNFIGVVALDGSTSVTLSIKQNIHHPIPIQYVTNALPYWIVVEQHKNEAGYLANYSTTATVAEVEAALKSGREVKVRVRIYLEGTPIVSGEDFYTLISTKVDVQNFLHKMLIFRFTNMSGSSFVIFFHPQADGTYVVNNNYSDD